MKIKTFNEKTGNPFPKEIEITDNIRMLSESAGSQYHHSENKIKETTKKLAALIKLKKGNKTLDIGYGSNLAVGEALSDMGMQTYGLDSLDKPKGIETKGFYSPAKYHQKRNNVQTYHGSIEDIIDNDSELKNEKFDLATFWGSWESGGNNFAIGGEMGEFRIREKQSNINPDQVSELMKESKNKIISDLKYLINPEGGIMIISSRYANHGAGFSTDQLPWEKRIMLGLANEFQKLGASETYFVGISKNSVQQQLDQAKDQEIKIEGEELYLIPRKKIDLDYISKALTNDQTLFEGEKGVYEITPSKSELQNMLNMNVPLGRIDAIYGKFGENNSQNQNEGFFTNLKNYLNPTQKQ